MVRATYVREYPTFTLWALIVPILACILYQRPQRQQNIGQEQSGATLRNEALFLSPNPANRFPELTLRF